MKIFGIARKSFSLVEKGPLFGARYVQVLLMLSGIVLAVNQRVNISVALVAMTNATRSDSTQQPQYQFSGHERSSMLGSAFWGALCTQLLGGYFASRYGTVKLLCCSVFCSSLLSVVLPWSLHGAGCALFVALRVLQGLSQGVMFPCVYAHLAKWCPLEERSLLGGIAQTGLDMGTALGFVNSGLLGATSLGWPSMFYVPGAVGLLWCVLWLLLGAESPAECVYITERELARITAQHSTISMQQKRRAPIPWCAIFTSTPYLVLLLVKISHGFSFFTLMQQIPLYIHGLYQLDIRTNALLSAIPFLIMCASSYMVIGVAHYLLNERNARLAVVRKSLNTISTWLPAAAFVAMNYVRADNVTGNLLCLTLAVTTYSAAAVGSSLNHLDLSPHFAGIIFGITNTAMTSTGIISPIVVAHVVKDQSDRKHWNTIFLGIAVLLFVGNLLYLLFGQMVAQPWDEIPSETEHVAQGSEKPAEITTNVQKTQSD